MPVLALTTPPVIIKPTKITCRIILAYCQRIASLHNWVLPAVKLIHKDRFSLATLVLAFKNILSGALSFLAIIPHLNWQLDSLFPVINFDVGYMTTAWLPLELHSPLRISCNPSNYLNKTLLNTDILLTLSWDWWISKPCQNKTDSHHHILVSLKLPELFSNERVR